MLSHRHHISFPFLIIIVFFASSSSSVSSSVSHARENQFDYQDEEIDNTVLHGRNVFTCGFGSTTGFASNFLQAHHLHRHKYINHTPFSNISEADVVVVYGLMAHCIEACSSFEGLVIYIDGEAGRPIVSSYLNLFTDRNKEKMIYLGVPAISLPPSVKVIPCIFGSNTIEYSSTELWRYLGRQTITKRKTLFLAYAASKCLPVREMVFDALVNLSAKYKLGNIIAYGSCHGSTINSKYSHVRVKEKDENTSRQHFRDNGAIFRPHRFVLAMENDDVDYYMTEKILNAFQSGAIPIYWGASNIVHDMFHPDTFIYVDPHNMQPALDRILEIERDPVLYRRILETPILLHGEDTVKKYFAVGIPASSAKDPAQYNSSLSNRIWASIIERLNPITAVNGSQNHNDTVQSNGGNSVLSHRNVFICGTSGFPSFATNFLQAHHLHRFSRIHQFPFHNASKADVVVVFGAVSHCLDVCSNFSGLVIYVDNEAGRPMIRSFVQNISKQCQGKILYLGVSSIELPSIVEKIPCIIGSRAFEYSFTALKRVFTRHSLPEKSRFLAYSATSCHSSWEHLFDTLVSLSVRYRLGSISKYGPCPGSSHNMSALHLHERHSIRHSDKSSIPYHLYKFVLTVESDDVDYYMTENIFHAFQAGAIPIYWGASNIVHDMFHPDTFIYVDPHNMQPALDRILEIERDPVLYRRILETPILLHGEDTVKKYFAVGIPASSAKDPAQYNSSLSNRIWASIIERLNPINA